MSTKSRNISIPDYLEELQIEYFLNELRSKIYPKKKDRDYYKRVYNHKRLKIEDISSKNKIPSIFTDSSLNREYRSRVYLDHGPPSLLNSYELVYYYRIEEHVKVLLEDSIRVGVMRSINFDSNIAGVQIKGASDVIYLPIKRVTRIF